MTDSLTQIAITISAKALKKALGFIGGSMKKNPIVPALENIHFDLLGGILHIKASDLQTTAIYKLPVESEGSATFLIPFENLNRLLITLPEQPVSLVVDTDRFGHVVKWDTGKSKLTGENPVDYPRTPIQSNKSVELRLDMAQTNSLVNALHHTVWATSTDELRPAQTGVYFREKFGQLWLCALDGFKLIEYPTQIDLPQEYQSCIVRASFAKHIVQAYGDGGIELTLRFSPTAIEVESGDSLLIGRLIDERYPDYDNAIPKENNQVLSLDRLMLIASLKRIILTANIEKIVVFTISEDKLTLSSCEERYEIESDEVLPCEYDGQMPEIAFRADSLIVTLSHIVGDTVKFFFSQPNRAALIAGDNEKITTLFMPSNPNR